MLLLAVGATAALALPGLGRQPFWDDEAFTAVYARNLLRFRRMTAWDGTNVIAYRFGRYLGDDLGRELRVPALPTVVTAGSFALLGETTFAGRLPFVLIGVLTVAATGWWLRRHGGRRSAYFVPPLLLALSPAFLLYVRNCRYYAPGALLTVLLLALWAPPGRSGAVAPPEDGHPGRRLGIEAAALALVALLMIHTHYLNAAAALAVLPVFFLDRRYRRPRQAALLAVAWGTALAFGAWLTATANPWAGSGFVPQELLSMSAGGPIPADVAPGGLPRVVRNLGRYLRDLGTAEMVPWALLPALVLPWIVPRCAPAKRTARQALLLIIVLTVYVAVVAALLPADAGHGPRAEMRYVVPLLAIGAALAGGAMVVLGRLSPTLAAAVFLLLIGTNTLHLSFAARRPDGQSAWGSTLWRYVGELTADYQTGNEAMLELLGQLPEGTVVCTRPVFLTAPALFYAPQLRYGDQLTERKPLAPRLRGALPDHVFVERCRPEVVLVPADALQAAFLELDGRFGRGAYVAQRALAPYWFYTTKPGLPSHWFKRPPVDGRRWPGLVALVDRRAAVAGHRALQVDTTDLAEPWRLGVALLGTRRAEEAENHLARAMGGGRAYVERSLKLADHLAREGKADAAALLYETVLHVEPQRASDYLSGAELHVDSGKPWLAVPLCEALARHSPGEPRAHVGLGLALASLGRHRAAAACFGTALELEPELVAARVYLGEALLALGRTAEGRAHLRSARESLGDEGPLAARIERMIERRETAP